jgi:hypothetical protein
MKIVRNAGYVAIYIIFGLAFSCLWLVSVFADWAELRLVRMPFGAGPNGIKEWVEAILFWVALGLGIHFLF